MSTAFTDPNTLDAFSASEAALDGSARGFPLGYFIIRSIASGKILDVPDHTTADGAELVLFDEKESSLVESMRKPEADNQVFFIDSSGALAAKHSGHAVDVQGGVYSQCQACKLKKLSTDGALVLRRRKPILAPYPNQASHNLPKFEYSPVTGHITITFDSDPLFPPPLPPKDTPTTNTDDDAQRDDFEMVAPNTDDSVSTSPNAWVHEVGRPVPPAWKQRTYLLTSIPSRRPRTFADDATEFFVSSAALITAPLSGLSFPFGSPSEAKAPERIGPGEGDARPIGERVSFEHMQAAKQYDLFDHEVVEEERSEEAEIDDNPHPLRKVKVVGYRHNTHLGGNTKARDRRRWEILPIRRERKRF
ncbi:hypothetical protein FS842_003407 [Serendipita sp. 407]|nr:hypothetical protein FS842_003407 [Serendipita sp. 407]